jgi:hypothetical protein
MSRTWAAAAAVLAAGALLVVAVSGCRATSPGERIDVPAIERELEHLVSLELLQEQFYDRTVDVGCMGEGTDGLHLRCHVWARRRDFQTQEWDEHVSCAPRPAAGEYRCYTDSGYALQ